jgi:hypothetical protein
MTVEEAKKNLISKRLYMLVIRMQVQALDNETTTEDDIDLERVRIRLREIKRNTRVLERAVGTRKEVA